MWAIMSGYGRLSVLGTFVVEAGNSFGLLADSRERFGLTVNRIMLAPNSGIVYRSSEAHRLLIWN